MMLNGPPTSSGWIYNSTVNSNVEARLRKLLVDIGTDKILGIQVCAYKDGKVIIDTAAGVLGKYDPRTVEPDSLFPVFSVTKGITAGLVHWLVDKGKLRFDETIANIWPNFGNNKKDLIQVHHVLNHTAGLQNAMGEGLQNPLLMCDWEESLNRISKSTPETEPGSLQIYHYLSFGWLCGGIIEHASGKKFQQVLEEAIIHPLNIEGEMYVGIPPGVESRLATLTIDMDYKEKIPVVLSDIFNTLNVRHAIIPAANGHCSARALARYYAALAAAGQIPPPHSSCSKPPLGSHQHIPKPPSITFPENKKDTKSLNSNPKANSKGYTLVSTHSNQEHDDSNDAIQQKSTSIFENQNIHDAIMGTGDFSGLTCPDGKFGLGFWRYRNSDGKLTSFGHSGLGGSTAFCDVENNFSMAVTVNKMSLGEVTRSVVQMVCADLGIPLLNEFSSFENGLYSLYNP